ncbi:MAG: sporulation integral membrane protein YtvI [Clostridia bacterium]|nr:sporulation integral membrane protein YtvI [Clostridia bacterium]
MKNKDILTKWCYSGIFIAVFLILIYLFFKWLFPVLLPFLLAYGFSRIVKGPADLISRRTPLPEKFSRGTVFVFFAGAIGTVIFLLVRQLFTEAGELARHLSQPEVLEGYATSFDGFISSLKYRFPFVNQILEKTSSSPTLSNIRTYILDGIKNSALGLSAKIPSAAADILSYLPGLLFSLVITLILAFYLSLDPTLLGRSTSKILDKKSYLTLYSISQAIKKSTLSYLKGSAVLFVLTFAELFFAFTVIRIRYAFVLALGVALADLLPVIGAGTIIFPLGGIMAITGDTRMGLSLIAVGIAVTVIRQFAEPKIIGHSIGLHPVFMLMSIYVGSKFLGFIGIVIGPIAAMTLSAVYPVIFESNKQDTAVIGKGDSR